MTAVLLLDEADVFLEQRIIADMQRNSLVSSESNQMNLDYCQAYTFEFV